MKKKLQIEGMTCANCQRHVEEALGGLEQVDSVKVNLKKGFAKVKLNEAIDNDCLTQTVNEAGYQVVGFD